MDELISRQAVLDAIKNLSYQWDVWDVDGFTLWLCQMVVQGLPAEQPEGETLTVCDHDIKLVSDGYYSDKITIEMPKTSDSN